MAPVRKSRRPQLRTLINVPEVVEAVATLHLLSVGELLDRRRWRYLVDARRDVIFALDRRGVGASEIGRVLGFHHSTVIHHLQRRQR